MLIGLSLLAVAELCQSVATNQSASHATMLAIPAKFYRLLTGYTLYKTIRGLPVGQFHRVTMVKCGLVLHLAQIGHSTGKFPGRGF